MKTCKKILIIGMVLSLLLALCACSGGNQSDDKKDAPTTTNNVATQPETTTTTTAATNSNDTDNADGMVDYQVKVLDGQGSPMTSGIVVKFLKNGEQIAMQKTNADGIAAKKLEKGDYTVELMFTDSSLTGHYDVNAAVLSADKTTLELSLISTMGSDSVDLFVGDGAFTAYVVNAGSTYVPVKKDVRNYFLFTPTQGGTYEFRVDNSNIKIGYYGAPHFVQAQGAVEAINNVITLSISDSSLGGTYVIGLDGLDADTNAVLGIIRTGDPTITISDLPWTEYKTTHTPSPYALNLDGKTLQYVDIKGNTNDNQVIFNKEDGYYHYGTVDGPVVLIHLGKKAPYVSLQTVIEGDGLGGGAPIREYFFDANGEFLKKEDYTSILRTYFENMDKNAGVYPLTEDLVYIIKNGCHGWWEKESPDYIFEDCNPEIGWMFALCYIG